MLAKTAKSYGERRAKSIERNVKRCNAICDFTLIRFFNLNRESTKQMDEHMM